MPRLHRMIAIVGLAVALLAARSAGRAEEIDKATQETLQSIITQQIDAFGRDDAAAAHSFASPGIKTMFPDANAFNAMVHKSYAPLIHPKSTRFEPAGTTALGPTQKVTIVDSQGQVWTAMYTFEQVDGQWRISGCVLVQDKSTTV